MAPIKSSKQNVAKGRGTSALACATPLESHAIIPLSDKHFATEMGIDSNGTA